MATLRTEDLTKSYSGRTVVRGVNLDVSSGEVVGLLGPNGAGKTTTFYMTVGLTAPDAGRVLLEKAVPNQQNVTAGLWVPRLSEGADHLLKRTIFRRE